MNTQAQLHREPIQFPRHAYARAMELGDGELAGWISRWDRQHEAELRPLRDRVLDQKDWIDPKYREATVCFDCFGIYLELGSIQTEPEYDDCPAQHAEVCPKCQHARDLHPVSEAWQDVVGAAKDGNRKAVEIMEIICEMYLEG